MKYEQVIKTLDDAIEICKNRAFVLSKKLREVKRYTEILAKKYLELKKYSEKLEKEIRELEEENKRFRKILRSIGVLERNGQMNEEVGKALRFLFVNYLELWGENPPERFKSPQWRNMLGRVFKDLVKIYQGDYKALWKDYLSFYEMFTKCKNSNKFNKDCRLFTDGGILNFKQNLPQLKTVFSGKLKEDAKEKDKWLKLLY